TRFALAENARHRPRLCRGHEGRGGQRRCHRAAEGRHPGQFAHDDDGQEQSRGRRPDPELAGGQGADQEALSARSRKQQAMHGTKILTEADRLMTVCNSCRYCEGLCAVFPAMEMRRSFSDGDLNYLANLCHACGACYTDCQFSPPHEFNVNVPKTFAIARAESYAAYAWPGICSGVFARNGLAISLIAALSVAAFIFGFAAFNDRQVLFGVHTGPGALYKLMPHKAMAALFGAAFLYAILAWVMGVRAFWRDIGEPIGVLADPGSLWQANKDASGLRYLDGCGAGCFNEDEPPGGP